MATRYRSIASVRRDLLPIETMCYMSRFPVRAAKIKAFTDAVLAAIPPDNEAALHSHQTLMHAYLHPNMLAPGPTVSSVGAHEIAASAVTNGVPVEVVNFLAGIHLSPDTLLKE
jgi:hypothetical protein